MVMVGPDIQSPRHECVSKLTQSSDECEAGWRRNRLLLLDARSLFSVKGERLPKPEVCYTDVGYITLDETHEWFVVVKYRRAFTN